MKRGKAFSKNTNFGILKNAYGGQSGTKFNWEGARYRGKKFVKWNEVSPEDRLHEKRVNDFFQNRRKYKKENI